MGPILMFRTIAGVAEGLAAPRILTGVRFLTCVRPEMSLQVLQSGIGFETALEL